jgi:hypothetical protein
MEKIPDIEFINGKRTETFKTIVEPESKKATFYFEIQKGEETRQYPPVTFLEFILEVHYSMADKTKNYRKQLIAIANAESTIQRYISEFDLDKKGFDFTKIFTDIEVTKKRLNAYHEYKEKWRDRLFILCGVILGGLITHFLSPSPQPMQTTIVLPKSDTVYKIKHDTIWIEKKNK